MLPKTSLPSDKYDHVPPRTQQIYLLPCMKPLEKNVNESWSTAQDHYKKKFDRNVRMLPTFEADQFVYINKPPSAVLASETDKVATASYNKLVPRVLGPHETVTVRANTLTELEADVENTINIDLAAGAAGLNKSH